MDIMENNLQLQKAALNILKEVDRICNELHLRYWVMYGTLIGTVRHNGFIPWDDDLDIAMPRQDYKVLHDYFIKKKIINGLHLDCVDNCTNYPFYIDRICDDTWRLDFQNYLYVSGAFIDVYPLDGMGNDMDKEYWEKKWPEIYKNQKGMHLSGYKKNFFGKTIITKIFNTPFLITSKIRKNTFYFRKLDSIAQTFDWDDSDYVGLTVWDDKINYYNKKWFEQTIYMQFEDFKVPVPSGYDELLKLYYGDYLKLPPVEQRVATHGYNARKLT